MSTTQFFNALAYTKKVPESHVGDASVGMGSSPKILYSLTSENPIAAGANGTVYPIKLQNYDNVAPGTPFLSDRGVMKVFSSKSWDTAGKKELEILRQLPVHPHLVRMIGEDSSDNPEIARLPGARNGSLVALLQPYCPFGDLLTYVDAFLHCAPRNGEKVMNYIELACITLQLLCALRVMHYHGWGHLDIKPDNILVESLTLVRLSEVRFRYHSSTGLVILGGKNVDSSIGTDIYNRIMYEIAEDYPKNPKDPLLLLPRIVLGDMGAVKRHDVSPNELSSGTAQYTAPEIWKKLLRCEPDGFSPVRPCSADIYSLGSTVWTLAAAFCPYDDIMLHKENITRQQRKAAEIRIAYNIIRDENVQCPLPRSQPPTLYQLIVGLMCHNVYNRLTADKAITHSYFDPIYERLENPYDLRSENVHGIATAVTQGAHRSITQAEFVSPRPSNDVYDAMDTVTLVSLDTGALPATNISSTNNPSVPLPPIMVRRNTTIDDMGYGTDDKKSEASSFGYGITMDRPLTKERKYDDDTFMDLSPIANAAIMGTTLSPSPTVHSSAGSVTTTLTTTTASVGPTMSTGSVPITSLSTTSSPKPTRKRNRMDHEADNE